MARYAVPILILLCGLVTAGCDSSNPSEPPPPEAETGLSIRPTTPSGVSFRVDQWRIHVEGPTDRTVTLSPGQIPLVLTVAPGSYMVAMEGLVGGRVEALGEQPAVVAPVGQTTSVTISVHSFVPEVTSVTDSIGIEEPFTVSFDPVQGASQYTIEFDYHPDFLSVQSAGSTTENQHTIVLETDGTVYLRVYASNRFGSSGQFSESAQLEVIRHDFWALLEEAPPSSPVIGTRLADGRVFFLGRAITQSSAAANAAFIFDPAIETFHLLGETLFGHTDGTATPLLDGRILLVGGGLSKTHAETVDPVTGTFSAVGPLAVERRRHRATRLEDGRVVLTGGTDKNFTSISQVEIFEPSTSTFSVAGSLVRHRDQHVAHLGEDGRILVIGGFHVVSGVGSGIGAPEFFDPTTGQSEAWNTNVPVRGVSEGFELADGDVLLFAEDIAHFTLYDRSESTFGPPAASPHTHGNPALLHDGRIVLVGGVQDTQAPGPQPASNRALYFDPASSTFKSAAFMDRARLAPVVVTLEDGRVLVVGGWNLSESQLSAEILQQNR